MFIVVLKKKFIFKEADSLNVSRMEMRTLFPLKKGFNYKC